MTDLLEPHLKTVLGDYPHTRPLRDGKVTSEHVRLDFVPVSPVHKAFAPMVRYEPTSSANWPLSLRCRQSRSVGRSYSCPPWWPRDSSAAAWSLSEHDRSRRKT